MAVWSKRIYLKSPNFSTKNYNSITHDFLAIAMTSCSLTFPRHAGFVETTAATSSCNLRSGTLTAAASNSRSSAYNAFSTSTDGCFT